MLIRTLDPANDLPLVEVLYAEASDYWLLADRVPPDRAKAAADGARSRAVARLQTSITIGSTIGRRPVRLLTRSPRPLRMRPMSASWLPCS